MGKSVFDLLHDKLEDVSSKSGSSPSYVAFNLVNLLRAAGSGLLGIAGAVTNPILLITAIHLVIADLYVAI